MDYLARDTRRGGINMGETDTYYIQFGRRFDYLNKYRRLEHMRNYKALEGVIKSLRWVLGDKDVNHPLE